MIDLVRHYLNLKQTITIYTNPKSDISIVVAQTSYLTGIWFNYFASSMYLDVCCRNDKLVIESISNMKNY